jgi:hypothetical protein
VDPTECAGATADLCDEIPAFTGEQQVDGVGDEFCNIPGQVVNFENSAFSDDESGEADTSSVEAYVRVAWDEDALRAHVHVKDPVVAHSGGEWSEGDTVQFFFSPYAPERGSIQDNDALPIALLPTWNSGEHYLNTDEPGTLTSASRLVDDGYEVEIRWEWGGERPDFSSGDTIGFDFQIGAQQRDQGRDFEFALALENPDDSACDNQAKPWCDVGHWCSPALAD